MKISKFTAAPGLLAGFLIVAAGVGAATKAAAECSVEAAWTGDFEGSADWVPDKAQGYAGFVFEGQQFQIETGRFNLTASFETTFGAGTTGIFNGEASSFYVTDAPYEGRLGIEGTAKIGFPMHDEVARGVPVSLEITEWGETTITGSVNAGPFTGVAAGPEAPREGGANGPLKPLTVNGSAEFHVERDFSGDAIDNMVGRRKCHKPSF